MFADRKWWWLGWLFQTKRLKCLRTTNLWSRQTGWLAFREDESSLVFSSSLRLINRREPYMIYDSYLKMLWYNYMFFDTLESALLWRWDWDWVWVQLSLKMKFLHLYHSRIERESDLLYEMMKLLLRKMDPSTGLSLTCAAPPLLVAFIRTSHLTMSMLLMQFIILFRSFLCVAAFFSHSLPTEMYDFLNMCMSQLPCGPLCI